MTFEKICFRSISGKLVSFKLHDGWADCYQLPGASTGDLTHNKVMWKTPDEQGGSGLAEPPGPA